MPSSADESDVSWDQDRFVWRMLRRLCSVIRVSELRVAQFAFGRLSVPTRVTRGLFGAKLHIDVARSTSQQLLYLMGERLVTECDLIRRFVRPGMRVVDVGANIGYHLLLFESLVGPSGEVICIEPSPENLPELRANISQNGFSNVVLHEVALGATAGHVGLRSGINSGVLTAGDSQAIADVPLAALSELVERRVDFVKIDVDGYEGEVIAGAMELFERDRPTVLVELHPHLLPRFGTSTGQIVQLLQTVYPSIAAFDQRRAGDEARCLGIGRRYFSSGIKPVADLDALLDAADRRQHDWTFWVVASKGVYG